MGIKIINETTEKIQYIHDFLTGPETMLFIVDMQGQDIQPLVEECIDLWGTIYDIQKCELFRSNTGYKASYLNKSTGGIKAVCQVQRWDESWVLMGKEFGATTVIFRRPVR